MNEKRALATVVIVEKDEAAIKYSRSPVRVTRSSSIEFGLTKERNIPRLFAAIGAKATPDIK